MKVLDKVELKLRAHNPEMKDLRFENHQSLPNGEGEATSQPIQFNINKPFVPGTIFVDKNNNGIATVNLTSNHVFRSGHFVFLPEGSATDTFGSSPRDIEMHVSVNVTMSSKEIFFVVVGKETAGPAGQEKYREGNVTIRFIVRYAAAE